MAFFEEEASDYILAGDFDPSSTSPGSFPAGTLFIYTSGGSLWQKQDDGNTTNYLQVGSGGGGGADTALSNLVPTEINQALTFGVGVGNLISVIETPDNLAANTDSLTFRTGDAGAGFQAGDLNFIAGAGATNLNGSILLQLAAGTSVTNITLEANDGGIRISGDNGIILSTVQSTFQGQDASEGARVQVNGGTSGGSEAGEIAIAPAELGVSITEGGKLSLGGNGTVVLHGGIAGGVQWDFHYPSVAPSVFVGRTPYESGDGNVMVSDGAGINLWKTLAAILTYDSDASLGGGASETLVVTGLEAADIILSVQQMTPGANNNPVTGWSNQAANSLDINWAADPGVGAIIRIAVKRETGATH